MAYSLCQQLQTGGSRSEKVLSFDVINEKNPKGLEPFGILF